MNNTKKVNVGGVTLGDNDFAVIAGPCSVESEAQFLETAQYVKNAGACVLRGGIWKLRTDATSFQGLGPEAFDLVKRVLSKTQMSLATEVTDPRQIEVIDAFTGIYQVGARNMYNYALLKELGQTKKPILLKRSFSALISEWIKAADYIIKGGNENVLLCERGIRTFETATRYTFDLNAVIYAKQNSSFPVIVDPSHAVGISSLVPQLVYAAAAVGADGVIVEVHPKPAEALSDGKQSLNFNEFDVMMKTTQKILSALDRKFTQHS